MRLNLLQAYIQTFFYYRVLNTFLFSKDYPLSAPEEAVTESLSSTESTTKKNVFRTKAHYTQNLSLQVSKKIPRIFKC